MYHIESMLSARLFLAPQLVGDRIFFISNLSGHLSLYAMDHGGSVPEPLLPPEIALQNPHLLPGESFYVFPDLGKIVVQIDKDGDEDYIPHFIPLDGGYPEPIFPEIEGYKFFMGGSDIERNLSYFIAQSKTEPLYISYRGNLETGELTELARSMYGMFPDAHDDQHTKVILNESYTANDHVIYLWQDGIEEPKLLYGTPLNQRKPGEQVPLNGIYGCHFIRDDRGIVFHTTLFEDTAGLGYLDLEDSQEVLPVEIEGLVHTGTGEFNGIAKLQDQRYRAQYNIDGCDWIYEGSLNEEKLVLTLENVIVGQGELGDGVVEHLDYEKASDNFAVSFSTATSPTQIYTVEGPTRETVIRHTNERILGIPQELLSVGEDASFTSFDGLRISARLYLPVESLGFEYPRPLVYYIHGGPQSQERPDFAWFSMPLIQFLTLNGFAVFVPNVRGSTGYGQKYVKMVDRDWGGKDRLDHVHAMTEVLPKDPRLDVSRAGVTGRSYGGYMTLTQVGRHPELWQAAVEMFGSYDLLTFSERIPETWKPYFKMAIGDPEVEEEHQFLIERSPRTYIEQMTCPMLVIQGKNDPRVVEQESRDLVERLQEIGKDIKYLMFEDEGHDVLKFKNRVTVYNAITDYFKRYLKP
jgi:esterase/lipase